MIFFIQENKNRLIGLNKSYNNLLQILILQFDSVPIFNFIFFYYKKDETEFKESFEKVVICKARNWEEVRIKGKFLKVKDTDN